VAVAVASPRTNVQTLRLAQPAIQSTSPLQVTAAAVLTLAAGGIWLFVLPLELLRFLG